MDGLALLCNLHADGPLSLRRLRASGVDTLEDLAGQSENSLASTLKASSSQVRRFLHEGRLLSRRLEELPLESEYNEDAPIPGEVRARLLKQIVRPPVAYDLSPPEPVDGRLDDPLDEAGPEPHQHEPDVPEHAQVLADTEEVPSVEPIQEGPSLFDGVPDAALRRASAPPEATPLRPLRPLRQGELPGLDSRTCQQLVAQGVRTYKALVDLANLNLARRTGIPFTRLLDLRHHARDLLASRLFTPEPLVEIKPQPRRVVEPPRAVQPLLRDPLQETHEPPVVETPVSSASDDPGVAGPFV